MKIIMRKTIAILSTLLVSGVLFAGLEFDQTEIVHSAGLLDEKAEAIFRFTNTGDEAITVTDPSSSCGCTVPKLEKKEYLPGETGEIRAVFTFGSRVGVQRKRITLRTTSPTAETYSLTMVTHIPEWVKVEPRVLRWKITEPSTAQEIRVTVGNQDKVSLELSDAAFRHFDVEIEEETSGEYIFTVTPKSLAERVTEFLQFSATVTDRGSSRSRQFGVHCLIR
jgi:hypothetical protein